MTQLKAKFAAGLSGGLVRRSRRPKGRSAFTLLETMFAMIIIGVGVLAFVDAQASFQKSNAWSSQAATGMLLANEVRELAQRLGRHDPVTGLVLTGTNPGVLTGWGRETGEITIDDIDDLDDLDGVTFGDGGTFAGPVNAFGLLVPETQLDGTVINDEDGEPLGLRGWRQTVTVQKCDPYNFNTIRGDAYVQAATTSLPAIPVDGFPLRITVVVDYTPVNGSQAIEITRLTWVVPTDPIASGTGVVP